MKIKKVFVLLLIITPYFCFTQESTFPFNKESHHLFFTSDFLYWAMYNDAISGDTAPGFKIGFGGILPHDNWQLYAEYTRISHSNSHTLNMLDLTLGKYFCPSKTILFTPLIGIKGADISSSYNLPHHFQKSSHFQGVGILAGFNTEWALPKYLRLFSNFSASCLNSSQRNQLKQKKLAIVKSTSHPLRLMIDLILGIKSDWYFNESKKHLSLEAGWELQVWFNQSHSGGNLSYQGLTTQLRFDF